jgi:LysM repeat protein
MQYHNNITTTGIVDNTTWNIIYTLYGNLDECIKENINTNNTYTVVKGDTLYSISRKFNISVDKLKEINNLSSNIISIGQVLKVSEDNNNNINYIYYTVIKGDTLYSISKRYKVSVEDIKSINNLSSNLLSIGQTLKIPENDIYTYYTVVKGDTLYSISKRYNISVEDIKNTNNLNSNLLSIGQILKIKKNQ